MAELSLVPMPEPIDEVQTVFDYWTHTLKAKSAIRCVLTDKRRRVIARALKDYDVATCLLAIDGCALSDFHMGNNSTGKKYDDIELILRDAQRIERFATLAVESKQPSTDFDSTTEVDW